MNLKASFWRRFFSGSIDILLLSFLVFIFSFSFIDYKELKFRNEYAFYLWCILIMVSIFVTKIAIPLIFNGNTLGSTLFKTKIVFLSKNKFKSILVRESFFSVSWMITIILIMFFVNHTAIIKYLEGEWRSESSITVIRLSFVTTIGSLFVFIQLLLIMTLIVSKDKTSFYDKASNTSVVIKNKFESPVIKKEVFKPVKIRKTNIEWEE